MACRSGVVTLAIVRQNGRGNRHILAQRAPSSRKRRRTASVALGPHGTSAGHNAEGPRHSAHSGRVVAVTFLLDGVPLGSDTTLRTRST